MLSSKMKKRLAAIITASMVMAGSSVYAMPTPAAMTLQDSINLALKQNLSIEEAEQGREVARWANKEAGRASGIAVKWMGKGAKYTGDTPARTHMDKLYTNQVKASIPIYTGGKLASSIKIQGLGEEIADLKLAGTKDDVIYQVTAAYYGVLSNGNMVKVATDAQQQVQDHLRVVNAMYNAGVVAKSDVLRTEVELANVEQQLVMAKNAEAVAKMQLDKLMGLPVSTEVTLKDNLEDKAFAYTQAEALAKAKANNKGLQQAKLTLAQAKEAIGVAKADYAPSVGGYAQYSFVDSNPFGKKLTDEKQVGIEATWQIFDNGVTESKVKKAQAKYAQAKIAVANAEDEVELAVARAYLGMEAANKNIKTTAVAVTKAKEDYKIAQLRYGAGVGTNLDVVDSRVALTNAENNHIKALYDFNVAKAQLRNIMGVE